MPTGIPCSSYGRVVAGSIQANCGFNADRHSLQFLRAHDPVVGVVPLRFNADRHSLQFLLYAGIDVTQPGAVVSMPTGIPCSSYPSARNPCSVALTSSPRRHLKPKIAEFGHETLSFRLTPLALTSAIFGRFGG